jgi:hypothetical protein
MLIDQPWKIMSIAAASGPAWVIHHEDCYYPSA